jgi:hypothetical protein
MGLFDRPYTDEVKESAAFLRPESLAVAKTAATKSIVLLRNEACPARRCFRSPQRLLPSR